MASVVSRFGGLADANSFSATLASSGSNRLIVAVVIYNCTSNQTLTAADINGTQNAEVVFTDISNGVAGCGIAVWNEADHPGTGSATFNFTFSASVNQRSYLVWELENSTQQASPYFELTNYVFDNETIVDTLQTVNVVDSSGVLGLAFIGARGGSFFDVTPTSSANLANDFETDNTNSHIYGADVNPIADNDEDYGFTLTFTGGTAPTRGHIGFMALVIPDTTAPTFDTAPAVDTTTDQGHTIDFTLNEGGTVYGVRLADGATAPSVDQVIAGTDAADAAAPEAKSVVVVGGVENSFTFSTGSSSTAYDYYIVAQDDASTPNKQAAVTKIDATTLAPTVRIDSTEPSQPVPGEEFIINLIQASNATGKTVTFNGYAVTPDFQDVNQIVIDSFPFPWELSTADSDFLTNYDLLVLDVTYSHTVTRQLQVPTGANYFTVQGVPFPSTSIFFDDPGLADGDKHFGEWLSGGQLAQVAVNGAVTQVDNNAQYRYRFLDATDGLWGSAGTDTFTVGTPAPSFVGNLTASNISVSSFNVNFTVDEDATVYIIVVEPGSAVPTPAQIKAGVDYGLVTVLFAGSESSFQNVADLISVTGLSAYTGQEVVVYAAAEDILQNLQSQAQIKTLSVTLNAVDQNILTFGLSSLIT